MTAPEIALVGTGPVAHALGRAYTEGGGAVACVVSRDARRANEAAQRIGARTGSVRLEDALAAPVVVVAVSDASIAAVGERLGALPGCAASLVLHTSGALSGAVLGEPPLRAGSLHPLQSLSWPASGTPDPAGVLASRLPGVHWFHEGEGGAEAAEMVAHLGGVFHALAPGGKSLYHAGAAILSNHTVALFAAARRLLVAAGVAADDATEPLLRLLAGTTANLAEIGLPGALTGPVSRGDVATVRNHMVAIASAAPDLRASYAELALIAVEVGLAKGTLDEGQAAELRALLGDTRN